MNKKEHFKLMADETIQIINQGYYQIKNKKISIENELENSIQKTILYSPESSQMLVDNLNIVHSNNTLIEVTNETTLKAAKRLKESGFQKVLALNFASAKNPGGGFLKGSTAQEESLARSSGLYASISKQTKMYDHNRNLNEKRALYSDYMIYSPEVPVFRLDNGSLIDDKFTVSFITSPAVNKGEIKKEASISEVHQTMKKRIEKILCIGVEHGYEAIVLGAFGCGVFKNMPVDVANYFKEIIKKNPKVNGHYKQITFAVYDSTPNKDTFRIFKNVLS